MSINYTRAPRKETFSGCESTLCQHTIIENNKDAIHCALPWQLLSCHYTFMKSFPWLMWRHIIMIKTSVKCQSMPLLPYILSLEILTCSGFVSLSIFHYDPISPTVGGISSQASQGIFRNILSYLLLHGFHRGWCVKRSTLVIYQLCCKGTRLLKTRKKNKVMEPLHLSWHREDHTILYWVILIDSTIVHDLNKKHPPSTFQNVGRAVTSNGEQL